MKIHQLTIEHRSDVFALPPLPEDKVDRYRVMSVHLKAIGSPLWWSQDGSDCDTNTAYRIQSNGTRSIEDPDRIPLLRFRFDGGGSLEVVYEGMDKNAAFEARPAELSPHDFAEPARRAVTGVGLHLTGRDVAAAVANSTPGRQAKAAE